ncbi:MAG: hypothetical protein AAF492_26870, partial [Verrucomicrobiota bacterium]
MKKLLAGLMVLLAVAPADARPKVKVVFEVAKPAFQSHMADNDLKQLEQDLSNALTLIFKDRFGFLDFDEPDAATTTIQVHLGFNETGSPDQTTSFTLSIDGIANPPLIDPWAFRSHGEYGFSLTPALVLDGFTSELKNHRDDFVVCHLSRIPLARKLVVLKGADSTHCILPYSYSELRARPNTILRVKRVIPPDAANPVGRTEWHHLLGMEEPEYAIPNLPSGFDQGILAADHVLEIGPE